MGETRPGIRDEMSYGSDAYSSGGFTYRLISSGTHSDYAVFVEGEDKAAEKDSLILSIALGNMVNLYDEKYDKSSFIKNVVLDNILPSDIYIKSKELHFAADVTRALFLVKFSGKNDVVPYEMVANLFPDRSRDYVISVGERDIVLVKELSRITIPKIKNRAADNRHPFDRVLYQGFDRHRHPGRQYQRFSPFLRGGADRP